MCRKINLRDRPPRTNLRQGKAEFRDHLAIQLNFLNKEQTLLEQYKQELIGAQKGLNLLKSTTNESEIENKLL